MWNDVLRISENNQNKLLLFIAFRLIFKIAFENCFWIFLRWHAVPFKTSLAIRFYLHSFVLLQTNSTIEEFATVQN